MARAYVLGVVHDVSQDYTREYEFVADDDHDARRMVDAFARVCHPLSCGPLWCVGETETRDGLTAIYINRENKQIVPLEVTQLCRSVGVT